MRLVLVLVILRLGRREERSGMHHVSNKLPKGRIARHNVCFVVELDERRAREWTRRRGPRLLRGARLRLPFLCWRPQGHLERDGHIVI